MMSVKFHPCTLASPSTTRKRYPERDSTAHSICKGSVIPNNVFGPRVTSKHKCRMRRKVLEDEKHTVCCGWLKCRYQWAFCYQKNGMLSRYNMFASTDDGVAVNGTPQSSSTSDMQEMRVKLDQSLQWEDLGLGLIQSIHDGARAIELAIVEHSSSSKTSWFSKAWLGVDRNAWVKTLSYQVAIYSLLQAVIKISSRGDGRDQDLNVSIERSLVHLSSPLESFIREELSAKQPGAYDWFWSHQCPMLVTSFVNLLESNLNSSAAITVLEKGVSSGRGSENDLSLLTLALNCIAAVNKLGPAKICCTQFFSILPDITGRLMDILVDFLPIQQTYSLTKEIGLHKEFLHHFGPRAAKFRVSSDKDIEEMTFWIDLVQKRLQQAIDRERIWSRLTTCESIEVLEKDLAIFGFFIALGRNTQLFLSTNGFSVTDYTIESIIRYFIGGSVLYYPQLSSISSYQLYVEVVCEELDWLPFYGTELTAAKLPHDNKKQVEGLPYDKVVSQIVDVCSHWTNSFIKYSLWLEGPSNVKAAKFLSKGHTKLQECRKQVGYGKYDATESFVKNERNVSESDKYDSSDKNLGTFDQALESVEEAINRLEGLLQELHISDSSTGKEHLKAACSDLQKLRKLKKEAEFLEASFRARAASLEEDNNNGAAQFSVDPGRNRAVWKSQDASNRSENDQKASDKKFNKNRGLWSFLSNHSSRKVEAELSTPTQDEGENYELTSTSGDYDKTSETDEIQRFELLRNELIELEKRVQRSNSETSFDEEYYSMDKKDAAAAGCQKLAQVPKKESIILKSIEKLKETSTDVWQGTQLLAIDVVAATGLIRRALTGDELAEKEKKALSRTLTDVASVVPIGILMLLPVTAVGHAAILAAIQRYVPSLIPSTYGPERLNLLRQLEKIKEMEMRDVKQDENESLVA